MWPELQVADVRSRSSGRVADACRWATAPPRPGPCPTRTADIAAGVNATETAVTHARR
jgi:hypothetical protein